MNDRPTKVPLTEEQAKLAAETAGTYSLFFVDRYHKFCSTSGHTAAEVLQSLDERIPPLRDSLLRWMAHARPGASVLIPRGTLVREPDDEPKRLVAQRIARGYKAPAECVGGGVTVTLNIQLGLLFSLGLDPGEHLVGDKLVRALFENAADYLGVILPDYQRSGWPREQQFGAPLHLDSIEVVDAYHDGDAHQKIDPEVK